MMINISVQYNGRFLPDIILLTQGHLLPPVLSTCPLHTNSGCGKEGRILIGPW